MTEPGIDWGIGPVDDLDDLFTPDTEGAAESVEQEYDRADPTILQRPPRSQKAARYEKKARKSFGTVIRMMLARPSTVPDGAALIMYSPKMAEAWGDLADKNEHVAKLVDMLEQSTDSPVTAAIAATAPLVLQMVRNHEPSLEPKPRQITIGRFNFRVPLPRVGIKLGMLRGATHDPNAFTRFVLSDPRIAEALQRNNVTIAASTRRH